MKRSQLWSYLGILCLSLGLYFQCTPAMALGWLEMPQRCNPHDPKSHAHPGPVLSPTPTTVSCRPQPNLMQLAVSNNEFALDLFDSLQKSAPAGKNITFSPFSISTALAMVWSGAEGQTASQMAEVLKFQEDPSTLASQYAQLQSDLFQEASSNGLTVTVANSLWLNSADSFSVPYLNLMQQNYSALVTNLSFGDPVTVVNQVNNWVSQETDQMIPSILSPSDVNPSSVAFLLNAIYFKGNWARPFQASATYPRSFYCEDGSLTTTSMMQQNGNFYYAQNSDAQILELPYTGNDYSMLLILPAQNTSLASIEAKLSPALLNQWIEALCPTSFVQVSLPKLALYFGPVDLKSNLLSMGMTDAFSAGTCNLDNMVTSSHNQAFVEFVKHVATVDVGENGTTAAAVTAVGVGLAVITTPMPIIKYNFNVNHPFLFMIRERSTGSILFISQVMNPNLQ